MSNELRPVTEGSVTGSNAATRFNEKESGEGGKKPAVDIAPYMEYIE